MSRRIELIDDINKFLGTDHTPTRAKQIPATMLFDIRDKLELDKTLTSRREILTELDRQNIIDTNQTYVDTKNRLGYTELKQLRDHFYNNVPRGIERARNKFKKVADE